MPIKNEKKNQHYVPKFYLRNFNNNQNCIATFIHSKAKFIPQASLDSVVSKDYFYGKDLYIENMFADFESKWATAFDIIINDRDVSQEETALAIDLVVSFTAFQYCRTLRTYDTQIGLSTFMSDYIHKTASPNMDVDAFLKQYIPEDFNPMIAPIKAGFRIKEHFRSLSLLILKNNSGSGFITSDNPVILYNMLLSQREYKGNYGFNSKGLCVFLPLSPDLCFCFYDPKVYFPTNNDLIHIVLDEELNELNRLTCRNAYEFTFYTPKHSAEYAIKLDKHFVDNLESQTTLAQSNLGPVIWCKGASILDQFSLPFLTIRKAARKTYIHPYQQPPSRYPHTNI